MNVGIRRCRCLSYNPDKYMPWHRLDVEVKELESKQQMIDLKSYRGIATRAHAHSGVELGSERGRPSRHVTVLAWQRPP